MGGFRCTYRNCTVRSDGQTHMFHYPVFDKPRCHQWLVNAQKLEFLDLKVSQLKNRVLCQHHFKDECFMNYKKDKLKFDAVPTENGPFCDASVKTEDSDKYTISLEDIEKELLSSNEKKANFSIKYGDFLINSELADITTLEIEEDWKTKEKDDTNLFFPYFHQTKDSLSSKSHKNKQSVTTKVTKKTNKINTCNNSLKNNPTQTDKSKTPLKKKKINIIAENKISSPVPLKGELRPISPSTKIQINRQVDRSQSMKAEENKSFVIIENPKQSDEGEKGNVVIYNNTNKIDEANGNIIIIENAHNSDANGNILIIENPPPTNNSINVHFDPQPFISQTNVHNPVISEPEITQVPHSNVTTGSNTVQMSENVENNLQKDSSDQSLTLLNVDDITNLLNQSQKTESQNTSLLKTDQIRNDKTSNKATPNPIKNKMPPERIAAIEQKRKINKQKLCDMIGFFLDEIDSQDTKVGDKCTIREQNRNTDIKTTNLDKEGRKQVRSLELNDKVKNVFSNHPKLPSFEEYSLASIESRIQRLEETLSRKIEQNSLEISELKSLVVQDSQKDTVKTRNIPEDDEICKKRLFNEISKYLSPNTNSLIFEELFINKSVKRRRNEL